MEYAPRESSQCCLSLTQKQALLDKRSRITLTDEKSKHGTFVDGEPISTDGKVLNGDEHVVQLGTYEHAFR